MPILHDAASRNLDSSRKTVPKRSSQSPSVADPITMLRMRAMDGLETSQPVKCLGKANGRRGFTSILAEWLPLPCLALLALFQKGKFAVSRHSGGSWKQINARVRRGAAAVARARERRTLPVACQVRKYLRANRRGGAPYIRNIWMWPCFRPFAA